MSDIRDYAEIGSQAGGATFATLTTPLVPRSCVRCEFVWQEAHPGGKVEFSCRRHPPTAAVLLVPTPQAGPRLVAAGQQPQMALTPQVVSAFPIVQPAHWCGDFVLKPA